MSGQSTQVHQNELPKNKADRKPNAKTASPSNVNDTNNNTNSDPFFIVKETVVPLSGYRDTATHGKQAPPQSGQKNQQKPQVSSKSGGQNPHAHAPAEMSRTAPTQSQSNVYPSLPTQQHPAQQNDTSMSYAHGFPQTVAPYPPSQPQVAPQTLPYPPPQPQCGLPQPQPQIVLTAAAPPLVPPPPPLPMPQPEVPQSQLVTSGAGSGASTVLPPLSYQSHPAASDGLVNKASSGSNLLQQTGGAFNTTQGTSFPNSAYPMVPLVINQQPQAQAPNIIISNNANTNANSGGNGKSAKVQWSSSLCSCCLDLSSCCLGLFCPMCYLCYVTEKLDESCFIHCFVPGSAIALRTKFRAEKGIGGSIFEDCLTMTFCFPCGLCQIAREMD